ncbi:hypothetical protein D5086_001566 [Populus alba]|uniref:Uncharacterized protein n=1 Tax=Populus alba TaxID=43335 RepID=A0ACC4CZ17_POPAL
MFVLAKLLPAGCVGGYCSGSVGLDVFGLWEIRAFGAFIDLSLLALFFSCLPAGYWIFVPFILFHFIGLVTAAVLGFVRVPMLSRALVSSFSGLALPFFSIGVVGLSCVSAA